jgi:G:T-mismatch repair DNA endonuclease (very short patch repair protein)
MDTLLARTLAREESLRNAGYNVISMWQCEWEAKLKQNEGIRHFVESLNIVPRLKIRDSFFG